MPLEIEDGSIVSGANSYVDVDDYLAWSDIRFGDSRDTQPDEERAEALLLRAMDYFEQLDFKGRKVSSAQPLQWPRQAFYIDGYLASSDSIPDLVKAAIFEIAYADEIGNGELSPVEREVMSEKIGNISVTYAENTSSRTISPSVSRILSKLIHSAGGFVINRV